MRSAPASCSQPRGSPPASSRCRAWRSSATRPSAERAEVLPPELPTVAVEAAAPLGWHEFADEVVGLTRFGASAPGPTLYKELGITAEAVAGRVTRLLGKE